MATKNKNEPLVLVVDDFADAREMYGEYLKFCGFRVAEAQNGVEAIDKAKRLKPDLILMDLSMPVVDGWEATRRLKADASTKGIPVVALTGHAMAGHSESAKSAGCDVVITKPCLPHDLIKEIKKVIGAPAAKDGKAKRTERVKKPPALDSARRRATGSPTSRASASHASAHQAHARARRTDARQRTRRPQPPALESRSRRRATLGRQARPQPDRIHPQADGAPGHQAARRKDPDA